MEELKEKKKYNREIAKAIPAALLIALAGTATCKSKNKHTFDDDNNNQRTKLKKEKKTGEAQGNN